jgi:formamidopyrimidine-DNA glycosylase
MPELPEVEVTRLALAPHVEGRAVLAVHLRETRLRWPVDKRLAQYLTGARVERLERRGKYLLWHCSSGILISHLGMSGSWRIHPGAAPAPDRHDHADLVLDGCVARLRDPRRFGALIWHGTDDGAVERHALLAHLGIEPFDPLFDGGWLYDRTRGRTAPIKQVLLAGEAVVGVGNIYASESLFLAGIDPRLPARRLGRTRCEALADAIRTVLGRAIKAGGSSLRDFTSGQGSAGYFTTEAAVYDRAGLPCRRCGTAIRRLLQSQRATYHCPRCQRR